MDKAASRARQEKSGRWRALYRDASGKEVSAGTYATKDEALAVARHQAEWRGSVELSPQTRATATFADVGPIWLDYKKSFLKKKTWHDYQRTFRLHVLPALGAQRLVETRHAHIFRIFQAWGENGMGAATQRDCRTVIKGIYAQARRMDIVQNDVDPTIGIEIRGRVIEEVRILTEDEWFRLYDALPTEGAKLFAKIRLATGIRGNEALALTPRQMNDDDVLTVDEVLTQLPWQMGENWEHSRGTKGTRAGSNGRSAEIRKRRIKLDEDVADEWWAFIDKHNIGEDEFVFLRERVTPTRRPRLVAAPTIGDEFVASNGRSYRHGTMTAYNNGQCHCAQCKAAMALYARENRKSRAGADGRQSRRRFTDDQPLTKESWFWIWRKACDEAGLGWYPHAYHLRHTYASWLSEAGMTDEKIAELLGHSDTKSIKHYVHHNHVDHESAKIMGEVLRGERRVTPPPRKRRRRTRDAG